MRRWAVAPIVAWVGIVASGSSAQTPETCNLLAYVRRLSVAPVFVAAPPSPPPPKPSPKDKAALARWNKRNAEAEKDAQRRILLPALLEQMVRERLGKLSGLNVIGEGGAGAGPDLWTFSPPSGLAPNRAALLEQGQRVQADAVLALAVDRYGATGSLQRETWLRAVGYLFLKEKTVGPFYAYGQVRAVAPIIRKLSQKDDETLAHDAAAQAARQAVHFLETGLEHPFARDRRVAIVPAALPDTAEKRSETVVPAEIIGQPELSTVVRDPGASEKKETVRVAVPSLKRQGDVLLQPELGPVVKVLDADEVQSALRSLGLSTAELWEGRLQGELVAKLAERLDADFVFLSRVNDVVVTDRVPDPSKETVHAGIDRHAEAFAEAALWSRADGRIVWRNEAEGGTVSHTETIRGKPRLRTEEQCVLDAVRTTYAFFRFSFEEYRRKFER